MAFAATALTAEPRSWSVGPKKVQLVTWTAASGDTSGTITATGLSRVECVIMSDGLVLTAAPTYATNVVTLAFTDPAADRFGTAIVIGV